MTAAQARWAKTDKTLAKLDSDTKAMLKRVKAIGKKAKQKKESK